MFLRVTRIFIYDLFSIKIIEIKEYISSLTGFYQNRGLSKGYKYIIPNGIFLFILINMQTPKVFNIYRNKDSYKGFQNTRGVQRFCSTPIGVGEIYGEWRYYKGSITLWLIYLLPWFKSIQVFKVQKCLIFLDPAIPKEIKNVSCLRLFFKQNYNNNLNKLKREFI